MAIGPPPICRVVARSEYRSCETSVRSQINQSPVQMPNDFRPPGLYSGGKGSLVTPEAESRTAAAWAEWQSSQAHPSQAVQKSDYVLNLRVIDIFPELHLCHYPHRFRERSHRAVVKIGRWHNHIAKHWHFEQIFLRGVVGHAETSFVHLLALGGVPMYVVSRNGNFEMKNWSRVSASHGFGMFRLKSLHRMRFFS
jgi:hypothetical protein